VTSSFAVLEAAIRVKSMYMINTKSILKTRKKREKIAIKEMFT